MQSESNPVKSVLNGNAESVLKFASTILGILYVLGLLVSNVQLMELGNSDFSSLHVRNVMTGFLFIVYLLLLLLTLAPIPTAVYVFLKTIRRPGQSKYITLLVFLGVLLACAFVTVNIATFVGTLFGYIYPWGRRWNEVDFISLTTWTGSFLWSDMLRTLTQFLDTYQYPKAITASLCMLMLLGFLPLRNWVASRTVYIKPSERSPSRLFLEHYATTSFAVCLFAILVLFLVSFAEDVYPNVKFNLGGGQPQIAELQIVGEQATVATLPGVSVCCGTNDREQILNTEPVAIWYQSDKFLYVSPLSRTKAPAQLIALDIKMVRTMRHVRKYIRVRSGGRISDVGSY